MDQKEKTELIDLVKTEVKAVAKLEAEGQFKQAEELHKGLETKLEKALEGAVTKEEFDKMEGELRKKLNDFEAGTAKDVTFGSELLKELTGKKDDLLNLFKGSTKQVEMSIMKDPGTFTTANSIVGASTPAGIYAINNNKEIVPIARRNRHVRELIGMGSTDESVWPFLQETPMEGTVGVQNPEGAKKSQTEYKQILVTATESTIAHFQKIGRQTLRNVRGIGTFIQTTMIADLLLKEDNDLLFGSGTNGTVPGIFLAAQDPTKLGLIPTFKVKQPTIYDCIAAFAALLANFEYMASFAAVHPVDYWRMVVEKDNDARYQQNIIFDSASSMLYVFGVPVVATTAIPIGNLGMGDGRYVMPLQREGISLRFFDQDEDNVQRNLVTARVEEAILNVIRRTNAFAYGSITDIKGSIDIPST